MKVAHADLFPSFGLTASGGRQSGELKDLADSDFTVWSIAANLTAPIIDGGRRRAELGAANARAKQALATYRSTVLNAFREVENGLGSELYLKKQEEATANALSAAKSAEDRSLRNYESGLVEILTVLDVDTPPFFRRGKSDQPPKPSLPEPRSPRPRPWEKPTDSMKVALKIIIPIAIIVLAVVAFKFLGSLRPEPKSRQPPPVVPVVQVIPVSPEDHAPPVKSYGTVSSYFETALTPQVSGRITYVSEKFRVGETVDVEHLLVKIDPTDYEAALAREESNLTVAERTFAEEEIRSEQAAGDWKASGRDLSTASDFVLRKPQLAAAQANIESAKAAIAKAQADLDRTEVRAPFPSIITARDASPGNQASPQASLGTLVSTEKVEIRLPLTADQIARLTLPASAELTSPLKPGTAWDATLVRMEPVVDQQNQVIYAVAEIEKPFEGDKPPLAVGIFANATIEADPIGQSYRVPEAAYVNDSFIWTVDPDGKLESIEAERLHADDGFVFLKATPGTSDELEDRLPPTE